MKEQFEELIISKDKINAMPLNEFIELERQVGDIVDNVTEEFFQDLEDSAAGRTFLLDVMNRMMKEIKNVLTVGANK